MSLQLYSHSKQDLEQVVEIVLNKVKNFLINEGILDKDSIEEYVLDIN